MIRIESIQSTPGRKVIITGTEGLKEPEYIEPEEINWEEAMEVARKYKGNGIKGRKVSKSSRWFAESPDKQKFSSRHGGEKIFKIYDKTR